MAAPAMILPPSKDEDPSARLCALLRDVRAEAQNLQLSTAEIHRTASLTDAQARTLEMQAALTEASRVLIRNRGQIDDRLQQVRALFQQDSSQYDWCGDYVTHIENYWDRVLFHWPNAPESADEVSRRIVRVDECLDQMVSFCGSLTIPRRLNDILENLRIGQPLDFHRAFADELPKSEQRIRLLDELAREPGAVEDGVIDAPRGLIYRASPLLWRRRASVVLAAGAAIFGFVLVWLFSQIGEWFSLNEWPVPPSRFPELGIGYVFLLLGSGVHLLVNALKQSRAEPDRGFIALDDWLLWLHVREGYILWGIVYLLAGYFAMAWSLKGMSWQTAFFAGYSIDSVVDLFLERFSKVVTTKTDEIKTRGAAAAGPA